MYEKSFWDKYSTWKEAESAWEKKKERFSKEYPLKSLSALPSMVGIAPDTKKHLKWKGFQWMVQKDKCFSVSRYIMRHPFRHLYRYLRSCFSGPSFQKEGDLYLYGIQSVDQFSSLLRDEEALFVVGFAYCQKPFECPSGRFSAQCIASHDHPVCSQCFIGKSFNALPNERTVALVVPTVHYIGRKMLELQALFPKRKIVFLMTACEMVLEMFGDFGNMANLRGVGIRLSGRFCNTFRAFELAERGVKPGLTLLVPPTEQFVLDALALWRDQHKNI